MNRLSCRRLNGSKELVAKCKEAGQRVVLITGSLNYTIEPLAEELGADDIITNRLEMKDGIATGRLLRPVVAGPEKAVLIVEDAQRHGHDLAECMGYSDSYSDVPMLSVVGGILPVSIRISVSFVWRGPTIGQFWTLTRNRGALVPRPRE